MLRVGTNAPYDIDPDQAGRVLSMAAKLPGAVVVASHEPAWFLRGLALLLGPDCIYIVRVKGNRAWFPISGLDAAEWQGEPTPRMAVDLLRSLGCRNVVVQLLNEPDIELPPDQMIDGVWACDVEAHRIAALMQYARWLETAIGQARSWWGGEVRLSVAPISQGNPERHAWWFERLRPWYAQTDGCVIHCYTDGRDFADHDWGSGFERYVELGMPLWIGEANDNGKVADTERPQHFADYVRFLKEKSQHDAWLEAVCLFTLPGGKDDAHKPAWWFLDDAILNACAEAAAEPLPFEDVPQSQPIPEPPVETPPERAGEPTVPLYDPNAPPVLQTSAWSCSAASLAWMYQSLGQNVGEWDAVQKLDGYISPALGLHNGTGAPLARALQRDGFDARNWYGNWADMLAYAGQGPMAIGGAGFYHWVGVRGTDGAGLFLANPAPNWWGIGQYMSYSEYLACGPFWVVRVPAHVGEPEEDPAVIAELQAANEALRAELAMRVQRDEQLITTAGYVHGDVVQAFRTEISTLRSLTTDENILASVGAVEAATNTLSEMTKP